MLLRVVARGIDAAVQIAMMELAFRCSVFLPSKGLISLGDDALFWVDVGIGLSALLTYTALSEALGAATFGKFCTGLRVVRADQPDVLIGLGAALIRNLALFVDVQIFGLVAYSTMSRSERRQRLGDHWANTVVVWRGGAPDRGIRGWPVGMAAAFALVLVSYLVAS